MIVLAKKTLAAIDTALEKDQGAAYRQNLQRVLPHMTDAYRGAEDGFRSHMGASLIGSKCGRAIWYGFHWFHKASFPGRILRLFNRGHLEEGRLIALLLTIGVQVYQQDAQGKQFRVSDHSGHFGGSGDGIAIGIPDLPAGMPAVTEWKTHNDASFKNLVKVGVREAKFEHFVQMQIYMHKMNIPVALYGAVNKNDDSIHLELVTLDADIAGQFADRARVIILAQRPPEKINKSPGWFDCKFCDYRPVCHLDAEPQKNCRTCKHVEVSPNKAGWFCANEVVRAGGKFDALTMDEQLAGCSRYEKM